MRMKRYSRLVQLSKSKDFKMLDLKSIGAIVLAGGQSRRMGQDKGLMFLNGKPMISHVLNAIKESGINEILIISNNNEYSKFGHPVFNDEYLDKGPLGGIHSGLSNSSKEYNLVITCDTPFVDSEMITQLMSNCSDNRITLVRDNDRVHQLIGIFKKDIDVEVKDHIEKGWLKMEPFNESLGAKVLNSDGWGLKADCFLNINSMEDFKNVSNDS